MPVDKLHHYTLACKPDELDGLVHFYTEYIGLTDGPRPILDFPGSWLYANGQPIVHLAAFPDGASERGTGTLDHISFRSSGLEAAKAHFQSRGLAYDEGPVPGWPLHQLFIRDPRGLKVELTFF